MATATSATPCGRRSPAPRLLLCRASVTTGIVAVLVLARPDLGALHAGLAAPRGWVARSGADAVAAQLALAVVWAASAWLAIGLLAGLLGLAPGALGRLGHTVSGRMLPAVLRAGLAGALGVSLATTPAWALAGRLAVSAGTVATAGTPAPSAHWPTGHSAPRPLPWPGAPAHPHRHPRPDPPPSGPPPGAPVVVRPGDRLWSLAASRLGPHADTAHIAAEWPRWYRANRTAIGGDPDLIRPGQQLTPPSSTAPSSTPPSSTPPSSTAPSNPENPR